MNPKPGYGTPDLKLSGDFHSSITLNQKGDDFEFDNTAKHAKYVTPSRGDYGYDNVLGLTNESEKKMVKILKKELAGSIRKALGV